MTASPTDEHQAPWFFRKRAMLFGAIYGVSFFFGYLIAGFMGGPIQPIYTAFGNVGLFAGIAFAFVLAGCALRVWASSFLAAAIVWQQDVQLGDLRESGPYRFTRNPLYVGNFLQAIGIGLLGPWQVLALLLVGMSIYQAAIVSVEEKFLAAQWGEKYIGYVARVARYLPLPWKTAPDAGQRGSLRDGLRSELMSEGIALGAAIAIAITWPR